MNANKKTLKKASSKKTKELTVSPEKTYTELEYESLRDDALEMARTLREIDCELHKAAMTNLSEECGYPPKLLLANLCKIMYSCYVNIDHETYKLT